MFLVACQSILISTEFNELLHNWAEFVDDVDTYRCLLKTLRDALPPDELTLNLALAIVNDWAKDTLAAKGKQTEEHDSSDSMDKGVKRDSPDTVYKGVNDVREGRKQTGEHGSPDTMDKGVNDVGERGNQPAWGIILWDTDGRKRVADCRSHNRRSILLSIKDPCCRRVLPDLSRTLSNTLSPVRPSPLHSLFVHHIVYFETEAILERKAWASAINALLTFGHGHLTPGNWHPYLMPASCAGSGSFSHIPFEAACRRNLLCRSSPVPIKLPTSPALHPAKLPSCRSSSHPQASHLTQCVCQHNLKETTERPKYSMWTARSPHETRNQAPHINRTKHNPALNHQSTRQVLPRPL